MTRKNWRGGEKKVLQKLKVNIGIPVQAVNFDKAQKKMKLQFKKDAYQFYLT